MLTRRQISAGLIGGVLVPALAPSLARAFTPAELTGADRLFPAEASGGMVASREATATRVGVDVLAAGGNAVDAAVAVAFALAVTLPQAGNLGGGGFALVHRPADRSTHALDFREMAPAAAHRDVFLAPDGSVDSERSRYSHHAVGVPGSVAGYLDLLARFGSWPRQRVMAPAIRLAEQGIPVTRILHRNIEQRLERFRPWPATMAVIVRPDGSALQPGDVLRQPDLAASLRQISEQGAGAFYEGGIAELIAAEMTRHHGPITRADLAGYHTVWRAPVMGSYRGVGIASMPPPSSGGAHLLQMLNILEGWDLAALGHNSAAGLHRMAEAMRRAYADRAVHLGDPDFWEVPLDWITSKTYAADLRAAIDLDHASPSDTVAPGTPKAEGANTTHLSVMDRRGGAVSMTTTLNFGFGSGIVAEGTGIFLNNEMDDFSAKPGVPNAYGLVGGEANAVAAHKRPLSSMTPTLLLADGRAVGALGSPDGSRIITTVLQVILNLVDHGMNLAEATAAPRLHHQWQPDIVWVEEGVSPDTLDLLRRLGHTVEIRRAFGAAQSVLASPKGFQGMTDPRRPGGLAAGPDH
ncbi:gamma-glutamyltransferase [Thalassobaculum litoreum]|uniref:Glutathione hydrolase proenzyme n=1 Tax=Thalassobaculum litoreum DSM 18839 TaxID=1123362 RepID=A0A8G2EVB0_9PROT|nr:gamma-glutamyltransferase [Thalassobaculum litoreum]SDF18877.1 gamma-glutamyltransferase 1 . Threonine peptidase. MEROPS family T03 [Thalassobaculum litoreum DSM 18839]